MCSALNPSNQESQKSIIFKFIKTNTATSIMKITTNNISQKPKIRNYIIEDYQIKKCSNYHKANDIFTNPLPALVGYRKG